VADSENGKETLMKIHRGFYPRGYYPQKRDEGNKINELELDRKPKKKEGFA